MVYEGKNQERKAKRRTTPKHFWRKRRAAVGFLPSATRIDLSNDEELARWGARHEKEEEFQEFEENVQRNVQ